MSLLQVVGYLWQNANCREQDDLYSDYGENNAVGLYTLASHTRAAWVEVSGDAAGSLSSGEAR